MLLGGKCGTIDSIGIEVLLKPEVTYNFEVADYHTYYVGECNVLVHNTCVKDLKKDPSISRDIQGEGKYGSYEITYKSGNKYIGKGSQSRMWRSAANKANKYSDTVKSVRWRSAISDTDAFIQEAKWMRLAGWKGKGTPGFYNLINSPGFKHL